MRQAVGGKYSGQHCDDAHYANQRHPDIAKHECKNFIHLWRFLIDAFEGGRAELDAYLNLHRSIG